MHVPTELVDSIIDEVFSSSGTVDGPTPSALALVSHTFRHRTNFHRFSKISFMHRIEPLSSVHDFLALLTSDVWTADVGIARHIREFSLALGAVVEVTVVHPVHGASQHKQLGPHPAVTDGSMAKILNMIFRYSTPNSEHQIDNTLVLSTYANSGYPWLFDINQRNSWEDLVDPQFGSALQGLLDTYVSKLVILRLNDLPPTLLAASRIRKLTLRKARFKSLMLHLQELGIDGESEFTQGFDQSLPTLGLPAVRHLRYYINASEAFWTSPHPWKHLGALETLTLDVTAKPLRSDLVQTITQYSEHLRQLKKLIIAVDTSLENRASSLSVLTGDFIIVNLLAGLISHLPWTNDLEVSFRSTDFKQTYRDGIAAIFGHFSYTAIDQII
ncbi:hypothetical protein BJ912DRAFT_982878, partial [Pholiota molesta]